MAVVRTPGTAAKDVRKRTGELGTNKSAKFRGSVGDLLQGHASAEARGYDAVYDGNRIDPPVLPDTRRLFGTEKRPKSESY